MSGEDLSNLVRRLRRFGERWPYEEPTAEMAREAADEIARLVAEVGRLRMREADLVAACRSAFEAFEYERYDSGGADAYRCSACGRSARDIEWFPHYEDCAWVLTGVAIANRLTADEEAEARRLYEELQRDIAAGDPWGFGPGASGAAG